ncbi:plasmid partitioning protein RepB C-terminal domain-containing protein [Mesorhizobium sp. 1B3]|uniref:plasmid partitioning protein RepB C-terminal domain-containing protein n=1 Tax=Mesorhizobium sp. 1B3 TaxID=3243599 RepID=UPI003D984D70
MTDQVRAAFENTVKILHIASILPRRIVSDMLKNTVKYRRIARSIEEVGIVEPLIVAHLKGSGDQFILLDGHIRYTLLFELGMETVPCLIADDDEAFTHNKRINRLATVQEHFMLLRAIKNGVSEEKLARALDLDIVAIKRRRTLLDGICPEAVEVLKDKSVNPATFDALRKMKPLRQVEVVELMATAGNFTSSYAKALLAATRQKDLLHSDKPKKIAGMTSEQMARMEREMASLHQDFKQIEESYGDDILHLVIASGYLSRLVNNPEIEHYLSEHHAEILQEFKAVISATSLD